MCERGNGFWRTLDQWVGPPLVGVAGAGCRLLRGKRALPRHPRSIGIICFAAIGDLLLASALCRAVRAEFPDAAICLYASKANADALSLFPPEYSRHVFAVNDIRGIVRSLRKNAFDILFDTTQWARIGAVLSLFSGAAFTVGFDTPGQFRAGVYDIAVPHQSALHETENFLNLVRAVSPRADAKPSILLPDTPPGTMPELDQTTLSHVIFMHMWASGKKPAIKEWAAGEWAKLALRCQGAGYRVVFTGSASDVKKNNSFLAQYVPSHMRDSRAIFSIAGKTSLSELAWLFSLAAAVVSVNTGIVHLAGLSGAITIDLHGPTAPGRWGARGPQVRHVTPPGEPGGYLYLGFEFPPDALPPLNRLSSSVVADVLRQAGIHT